MKCSFCGYEISKGKGLLFVKANGTIYSFCSSKCKKNLLKLRRKPRKIKWTSEYRKEKTIKKKASKSSKTTNK